MIDPYADRPVYLQLADELRGKIERGEMVPGEFLPSEKRLAVDYALGIDSIRSALGVLRREGMVETLRPQGTRVRLRDRTEILLELGTTVEFRAATDDDRRALRLPVGAYVAVMTPVEGDPVVYVADLHIFRAI